MQRTRISVIVPVYNGARFLAAALESVGAQHHRPDEVIVVDDGSTDDTAAVARRYGGVRYLRQPNLGAAAARNTGAAAATGELLAFLDADDRWLPAKLSCQVRYLDQHPDVDAVVTHQRLSIAPGAERPGWVPPAWLERPQMGLVPSALMIRRTAFEVVGGFDVRYRTGEDTDWFARAKDAGVALAILPEALVERHVHPESLTAQARDVPQALLRIVRDSLQRKRTLREVAPVSATRHDDDG
ncbi:MAG TPA: glycosyltransferase family A protein [Ktedonobacterales bacterium]|nr:glycosyltransferase family A protein [Ktedonobacterales bacterium]